MSLALAPALVGLDGRVIRQAPLSKFTSLRIGGPADFLVKPGSVSDMRRAIGFARQRQLPVHVLGNGTNTLFPDAGYPGVVLYMGPGTQLRRMEIQDQQLLVQAGASLAAAINLCKAKGFGALDFLTGIPATVGGALAMNAGIPEAALGEVVESVTVLDRQGRIRQLSQADCGFGYRASEIRKQRWLVLEAALRLDGGKVWDVTTLFERRKRQPVGYSAGCVFKNPEGIEFSAGWLIDKCGLKGYNVGDAQVSTRHGNFILNRGNALCTDVLSLIDIVRKKVYKEFNLELDLELEVVSAQSIKPGSGTKEWSKSRTESGLCLAPAN